MHCTKHRIRYSSEKVALAEKSVSTQDTLEYLGFEITRQDIMPFSDKIQASKKITISTNEKQLRSFIGVIKISGNTDW